MRDEGKGLLGQPYEFAVVAAVTRMNDRTVDLSPLLKHLLSWLPD